MKFSIGKIGRWLADWIFKVKANVMEESFGQQKDQLFFAREAVASINVTTNEQAVQLGLEALNLHQLMLNMETLVHLIPSGAISKCITDGLENDITKLYRIAETIGFQARFSAIVASGEYQRNMSAPIASAPIEVRYIELTQCAKTVEFPLGSTPTVESVESVY